MISENDDSFTHVYDGNAKDTKNNVNVDNETENDDLYMNQFCQGWFASPTNLWLHSSSVSRSIWWPGPLSFLLLPLPLSCKDFALLVDFCTWSSPQAGPPFPAGSWGQLTPSKIPSYAIHNKISSCNSSAFCQDGFSRKSRHILKCMCFQSSQGFNTMRWITQTRNKTLFVKIDSHSK